MDLVFHLKMFFRYFVIFSPNSLINRLGFIRRHKKMFIFLTVYTLLWIHLLIISRFDYSSSIFDYFLTSPIQCYNYGCKTLTDISLVNVRKGKSIFFHETSCNSYIECKIVIAARQACAVESAALLNPQLDIYLLYTSVGAFKFEDTESDRILEALLRYDNVKIHHLNFENYTKSTPLHELYVRRSVKYSEDAVSHASDILRYLTLWKYGGIYLDFDVLVIKSFETLPSNFVGCESDDAVAASMMGFEPDGIGHDLAEECVMDLKDNFNERLSENGPGVITRLVKKHCKVNTVKEVSNKMCEGLKVFSPEAFYPIPWRSWKEYFEEKDLEKAMNATRNSYIIRVWNRFSNETLLSLNSESAYATFGRKYCPKVYEQCDTYF